MPRSRYATVCHIPSTRALWYNAGIEEEDDMETVSMVKLAGKIANEAIAAGGRGDRFEAGLRARETARLAADAGLAAILAKRRGEASAEMEAEIARGVGRMATIAGYWAHAK